MTGPDAAATNDYDGDSIANLLEYALNGNPTNASVGISKSVLLKSAGTAVEHVHTERVTAGHGLTYTLKTTASLTNSWTPVVDATPLGDGPTVDDFKTVTNQIPTDGKTTEFIRLEITK